MRSSQRLLGLWRDVWPTVLAELAVEDAFTQPASPTAEEIVARMRPDGLEEADS